MKKFAVILPSAEKQGAIADDKISILFRSADEILTDLLGKAGIEVINETDYVSGEVLCVTPRVSNINAEALLKTYDEFCASGKDGLSFADGNLVWKKSLSADVVSAGDALSPIYSARDLLSAEKKAAAEVIESLLDKGVIFRSTDGVMISPDAIVESGAEILGGTIIKGKSHIASGAVIGPNSLIDRSVIGEDSRINASHVLESTVGKKVDIGPFSQVRPNTNISDKVHIGDFVELKNSNIGEGTCVSHLTYIGDSDVGKHVNFGCGVVTVNYNGETKNRCTVGDYAFIGCNTNLVAPVKVGSGAYTAAGSTITDDLPDGALGIARSRQTNKEEWAKKKLETYIQKKNNA